MVRFYIVEDEDMIREGLCECLDWQGMGAQVVGSAPEGETALREMEALCPEVVLSDVVMPIMTGTELAHALRKKGWQGEIIFLSAYQEIDYLKSALKAGAVDYVSKPIQNAELVAIIRKVIARVRERRDREAQLHAAREIKRRELWHALLQGRPVSEIPAPPQGRRFAVAILQVGQGMDRVRDALKRMPDEALVWLDQQSDTRLVLILSLPEGADVGGALARHITDAEDAVLAASEAVTDAAQLRAMYEEALSRIDMEAKRDDALKQCFNTIIAKNLQAVDIPLLIELTGLSKSSLIRAFRRIYGKTVGDVITHARIRAACSLLRHSQMRTYEVAEQVGYKDTKFFSGVFRQHIGMTPAEYRRREV